VVWSESDGLPGVIIDRYGAVFVLQTLTLAMDLRRESIVEAIVDLFGPETTIIERNDAPVRVAEGLESGPARCMATPCLRRDRDRWRKFPCRSSSRAENRLLPGSRMNYEILAHYARDRRVLDCFTNQGAFALTCARPAPRK